MVKLELNIGERLMATRLLNENGSNLSLSQLKDALKLAERIGITEAEEKKINYRVEPIADGAGTQLKWDDTEYTAALELSNEQHALLKSFVDKRDKDAKFALTEGIHMVSLVDKVQSAKQE